MHGGRNKRTKGVYKKYWTKKYGKKFRIKNNSWLARTLLHMFCMINDILLV